MTSYGDEFVAANGVGASVHKHERIRGESFQRQTVEAMGAGASGEARFEPVEADELERASRRPPTARIAASSH